jgi:hypothetical protein
MSLINLFEPSPFAKFVDRAYASSNGGTRIVAVSSALTNFRLGEAAQRKGKEKVSLSTFQAELAQGIFDKKKLKLRKQGVDFFKNFYVPELKAETQQPVYAIEDPPHKLKNCKSAVNNQKSKVEKEGVCDLDPLLLDKRVLERVARLDARFQHLVPIIIGTVDSQNVPAARELFCNREFQEALAEAGHSQEALVLFVFGRDFQAWDQRQLTGFMRDLQTSVYNDVIYTLFGKFLSMPDFISKAKFGGFPRDLLLARLGNNDARRQYMDEIGKFELCLHHQAPRNRSMQLTKYCQTLSKRSLSSCMTS